VGRKNSASTRCGVYYLDQLGQASISDWKTVLDMNQAVMAESLGIIPARGGSKGIPRKNIASFLGKPLICWSIEVALASQYIDRVIVSTDDPEIAEIAITAGAEVPFLRPPELSTDLVMDYPVVRHCLDYVRHSEDYAPDLVVQLRPTSPLRTPELVDDAIERLLKTESAESLRVVCESPANPYKMWTIRGALMEPLIQTQIFEQFNQPRQSLPTTYWQIGTLDVVRTETVLKKESLSGDQIMPYVVDQSWICDIDDADSLEWAEHVCRRHGMGET
jgi:CMP-N,N'-diacetyllegionaminic acid synthase